MQSGLRIVCHISCTDHVDHSGCITGCIALCVVSSPGDFASDRLFVNHFVVQGQFLLAHVLKLLPGLLARCLRLANSVMCVFKSVFPRLWGLMVGSVWSCWFSCIDGRFSLALTSLLARLLYIEHEVHPKWAGNKEGIRPSA